jgi:hypothetical protein
MRSNSVIQGCFPGGLRAKSIQRLPNGTAMPVPPTAPALPAQGGQPLPAAVLQKMESVFGAKFSDVRIHIGPEPAALGATAVTRGSHIYFAPGQYNPDSAQGQRILGYELAHVVQQRAGRVANPFGTGTAVVHDRAMEAEAQRMSLSAMQPHPKPGKK